MSRLRGFQSEVKAGCHNAWDSGAQVVAPIMCTGAGKTVLVGDEIRTSGDPGCSMAHRSELVGQISLALAREGVRHDIVAPDKTIKTIVRNHIDEIGCSYYNNRADWKVASVDTIIKRELDQRWLRATKLVVIDEAHHVLRDNKWGKAFAMFPGNPRGMFPTATPIRADGRGLGSHHDGLIDAMVEGPNMRWMIDNGYLTDYRMLAPHPKGFTMEGVHVSAATGDWNLEEMRQRVKDSPQIIGDVVSTYLEHCRGLLGITFAVDVEHATWIADAFNKAGVAAQVVHSGTPDADRIRYMRMFKNRELLQLVNVDLFGEGVDVPALEVVSMARPTMSYSLFVQQFGRALRLMISPILAAAWDTYTVEQRLQFIADSGKPFAWIIDHVGNIITHRGPPDWRTEPWSLDRRQKRQKQDGIPLRACGNELCLQPFERIYPVCPHCGWEPPVPADRSKPEHVDGDVVLYTQELLQQLFGQKDRIDGPCFIPQGLEPAAVGAIKKNHRLRKEAQDELRKVMSLVMPPTKDNRINDRKFFHTYGIDTLTAQTLGSSEADQLRQRILERVRG